MTTTTPTYRNADLTFGIEIETFLTGGKTRRMVADYLAANVFGPTSVVTTVGDFMGRVTVSDEQGRKWILISDSSIDGGTGCEIVSPPLAYADIDLLQRVVRAAKKAGCRVNESTGIHVHIGGKPFFERGAQAFKNLLNLWGRFEALTLPHLVNRPSSRWARAMDSRLREAGKTITSENDLRLAWYGCDFRPGSRDHYHGSRYKALNLHNLWFRNGNARTIEFRCFNGTLHAGKVRANVMLVLALAGHALTARSVRHNDRTFDASWTAYAVTQMFRVIGLARSDDADANLKAVRKHLSTLGKGHSGHATPAKCLAWAIRHNRDLDVIQWPASFHVERERRALGL